MRVQGRMAEVHVTSTHASRLLWLLCSAMLVCYGLSDSESNFAPAALRPKKTKDIPPYLREAPRHSVRGHRGRASHRGRAQMTTRLPEFIPDGPRRKMPDPTFLKGQMTVVANQGDIATLPCSVQNLGARQISWKKRGSDHFISIGTEVWVQDSNLIVQHFVMPAEVSEWNLQFLKVRLEDAGVYECQIIATDKLKWQVTLTVIERPPYNPEISIEGKKFVESGHSVYLRCNTTEGNRIPDDVDWFKDGNKIGPGYMNHAAITKYRSTEAMTLVSELLIANGESKDSGTYICRSSEELIASREVNVLVGKKADSANVKRGTGTSSTHTQGGDDQNHGCSVSRYFPFFWDKPVVFCISLTVYFVVHLMTS